MKDRMQAAVFEENGVLKIKGVPIPKITKDTDVLLKVDAVSICGSDLKILSVPPAHPARKGVIMGHEYVGTVIETGRAVKHIKTGDFVVVEPNTPCFTCRYCKENLFHMCENLETVGETSDGGFAEYSLVPATQIHKLPSDLPVRKAVLIEPLSCVVAALDKVRVQPADLAVVLGAGPLGLLFTQVLKLSGARVIVSDPSANRRYYAELCGANMVVDPNLQDLGMIVKDTAELGVDLVIDTVGSLIAQTLSLPKRHGSIILFGMNENAKSTISQYAITSRNLKIYGSLVGTGIFPRTIRLICEQKINEQNLITHELSLDQINEGIDLLRRQAAVKVVIFP
jgi:(R,R)-butanediol dehydrogenase/meso-butanediol dehydrogenase/diacetyl reductase